MEKSGYAVLKIIRMFPKDAMPVQEAVLTQGYARFGHAPFKPVSVGQKEPFAFTVLRTFHIWIYDLCNIQSSDAASSYLVHETMHCF